jgi:hypothetical protein
MAVESGGRGFASGKTAQKALLFLRLLLHAHLPRTPHDHMERINRPFADDQLDVLIDY